MKFVGIDLHKQTISVCVVVKVRGKKVVLERRRFACRDTAAIVTWLKGLGAFAMVVEATSSYEWLVQLAEPLARRIVLAHPGKLRVIAESKRKSDKLDAQVLAEFLASDEIPRAYRPTPRIRAHRTLVRYRHYVQRRITSVKNKLRHLMAWYNADIPGLFTAEGREHLATVKLSPEDRFLAEQLAGELEQHRARLAAANKTLREFAKQASLSEKEARAVLKSMPCMGVVTIDVVLAELGDYSRFSSEREVMSYAGLVPGLRESNGKTKQLGITKQGSRLLRWAMIELAWRMVGKSRLWGRRFHHLEKRAGSKKAIVAMARRLLGAVFAMLRTGKRYAWGHEAAA